MKLCYAGINCYEYRIHQVCFAERQWVYSVERVSHDMVAKKIHSGFCLVIGDSSSVFLGYFLKKFNSTRVFMTASKLAWVKMAKLENYAEIGKWLPAGNTLSFASPHAHTIFHQ